MPRTSCIRLEGLLACLLACLLKCLLLAAVNASPSSSSLTASKSKASTIRQPPTSRPSDSHHSSFCENHGIGMHVEDGTGLGHCPFRRNWHGTGPVSDDCWLASYYLCCPRYVRPRFCTILYCRSECRCRGSMISVVSLHSLSSLHAQSRDLASLLSHRAGNGCVASWKDAMSCV